MAWKGLGSWVVNALCGVVAYVVARWIWNGKDVFQSLLWEVLTFLGVYILLQLLVRGRRLARKGKTG
jgi:hypothetical protein